MSGRRYGEGTIYKRNDGRWAGSAYVKVTGGIQKRLTVYGRTRRRSQSSSPCLTSLVAGLRLRPDSGASATISTTGSRSSRARGVR